MLIKKLLLSLFMMISLPAVSMAADTGQAIGSWKVYPTYANPPQKVIETEDMVYYTTGGNLFSYNKKTDENYAYNGGNKLNDRNIINIFYNFDGHYLLIAYESGNIDLLYDDGHVVNLSDICDSNLVPPLTINAVSFDGDFFYLATSFGLVKYNEKRAEVVTSGMYNKNINAVTVMGDRLVIHCEDYFYWIYKNSNINKFDNFTRLYTHNAPVEIFATGENTMLVQLKHTQYPLAEHKINFENNNMAGWNTFASPCSVLPPYLSHGPDGETFYVTDGTLYTVSADSKEVKLADLPDDMADSRIGTCSGAGSVWSLNKEGLAHHSFDDAGGVTVLMDRFKPDAFTVSKVRYFYPSVDGRRLYAQNSGITAYRFGGSTRGLENAQTGCMINLDDMSFTDRTPYPIEAKTPMIANEQRFLGKYAISPTSIAEDPNDQSVYFLSTADDGIYKIVNNEYVGRYDETNSPNQLVDGRAIVYGVSMDKAGNMWTMTNNGIGDHLYQRDPVMILPAAKTKLDPKDVAISDWIVPDLTSIDCWGGMDTRILQCKKSNMVFMCYTGGDITLAYDTRGTLNDFTDDRMHLWEKWTDQDGNEVAPKFHSAVCEDLDGKVWFGTNEGIYEISSPSNALNPNMRVTHIKVPRNDGSNLADYLLGTDLVMDIAVDAANRKWIATYGSGLFLVSPSGNEILANYTTDNSPLLSDKVNCVYVDQQSGMVFIGTDAGLQSYVSDATPARSDYSDIFIYPNPVRPDYHGEVNITGLMDKSLVKITDASGAVVYQGRSEGGRFVWNVSNASGSRVRSGVYYVMVSQNATGSSSAAVAKIMVIN